MEVDWERVARVARTIADADPYSLAPEGLDETAAAARDQVVAATGLEPRSELPPVEWVSRRTWIDANIATMSGVVELVLESVTASAPTNGLAKAARSAGGAVIAAEIGGMLGLFARRVLGQYELSLLDEAAPPRLLLVGPNLDRAARDLQVDRQEFVTWVTLHEVTHAVQFGAVDWLRPRLGGALQQLLTSESSILKMEVSLDAVKELAESVRRNGLIGFALGEERKAMLDRVQGTMGLVEGHAEWAMDQAGHDVLRDVDVLRAAMQRRRQDRSPLLQVLDRLLGFDLKMKQYAQGREFCDAVVAARGVEGLVEVWSSEDLAPTAGELAAPDGWLARTRPMAA